MRTLGMIRCARADDGHQLLGGEFPLLVKILHLAALGPWTKQDLQMRRRDMHVPSRHIHHQRIRRPARPTGLRPAQPLASRPTPQFLGQHFANQPFHFASLQRSRNRHVKSFHSVADIMQQIPMIVKLCQIIPDDCSKVASKQTHLLAASPKGRALNDKMAPKTRASGRAVRR